MAQVASELISITNDEKLTDSKYIKDLELGDKKQSDINKDSLSGGVYNVTKLHPLQSGYYTLSTAIAKVPQALRSVGMVITYQTGANSWETKQFKGALSDFTDSTKWEDFGSGEAGDGVYDISAAYPNESPFASLQDALTAFTDTTKKKGGMTIKYIDEDSGKYVQYRLTNTVFSTEISDWESSDELKNALGYSSESTEGYAMFKPEIQVGYFERSRVTQLTGATTFRYAIINLLAGEKIRLNGSTPTNVGRIGTYISDSNLSDVVMGTSSSNTETYITEYEAPENLSIILGFSDNVPFLIEKWTISTKQTSILSSLQSDVNDIKESLDMDGSESTAEENVELTENYGFWYANTSRATISAGSSTSQYIYSDFIAFKKGDVLTVKAKATTTVGVITRKDYYEDGIYRTVKRGTDELETFTYTVPYDEELAFCWWRTTGISVKKTAVATNKSSATLAELSERIDGVEDNIVPTINERIAELGIESTIEDDLTEELEDGKFVNVNGGIGNNESYSYKLYNVTAGTEITFNAYFHTNLCPIAKKTSTTTFEPLVVTPGSVRADVSYTVPMDMVVALSFSKNQTRTVIIHSSKIDEIDAIKQEVKNVKTKLLNVDIDYGLLFDKVAVIGDSLSVGTLDGTTGDDAHDAGGSFGCSWLTCLAKRWGSSIRQHYATGGATCWTWLGGNKLEKPSGSSEFIVSNSDGGSNLSGLGLMLNDTNIYDVYFIAFGHNDAGKYTIGTPSDSVLPLVTVSSHENDQDGQINDVVSTVDNVATHNVKITNNSLSSISFISLYKTIVNIIRTKAPNAIIFMLSTDSKDSNITSSIGYMNQRIKELAEWYYEQGDHRVFYVDYINRYEAKEGYRHGGHWSTFGYVNVARLINEVINEVIEENLTTNALKVWGNYLNGKRTTRINTTESGSFLPHL